jgi:type IV secretion system protein VirB3
MWQPEQDVTVTVDPLFVGLTRPATILGVPYEAFVVESVLVSIIFLAVGDPFYMLLLAPLHTVLYLISSQNPNAFVSIMIWLMTKARCKNANFWGGAASFSPLASKKWVK